MFTLLYSLGNVYGVSLMLFAFLLCAALYCAIVLPVGRRPIPSMLGLLLSELVTDGVWYLYFYQNGTYTNPGLQGAFVLLLWPAALFTAAFLTLHHKDG